MTGPESEPEADGPEGEIPAPRPAEGLRRDHSFCGTNRGVPPPPDTPALPKPESSALPLVTLGPDRRVPQGWYTRSDLAAVTGRPFDEILGPEHHSAIVPVAVVDGTLPIPLFDDSTVELIARLAKRKLQA